MNKNQRGFGFILIFLIIVVILLTGFVGWYVLNKSNDNSSKLNEQGNEQSNSESSLPKLVDKAYCSDVCPQNTTTYKVYEGVNDKESCAKIGGKEIVDPGWGGYIGCEPK